MKQNGYKAGMIEVIPLDDFEITTPRGAKLHPHAGESITILAYGFSLADQERFEKFKELHESDQDKAEAEFNAIAGILGTLVVDWDITDPMGAPYPKPRVAGKSDLSALKAIPSLLFVHLMGVVKGDEPDPKDASALPA